MYNFHYKKSFKIPNVPIMIRKYNIYTYHYTSKMEININEIIIFLLHYLVYILKMQ